MELHLLTVYGADVLEKMVDAVKQALAPPDTPAVELVETGGTNLRGLMAAMGAPPVRAA